MLLVPREAVASTVVNRTTLQETAHRAVLVSVERERVKAEVITATDATKLDILPEIAPTRKSKEPVPKAAVEETVSDAVSWDISPETAQAVRCRVRDQEVNDPATASSVVNQVTLLVIAEPK